MLKLPKPPNNFGIQSVNNYYKKCNLKERLLLAKIELDKIQNTKKNESKAPGMDGQQCITISHANNTAMQSINFFR